MPTFAYFISSHGFGHAARASAVINALAGQEANARFHLFTTVPEWFFRQSLTTDFDYTFELVDIGLVQTTPVVEDVPATLKRLQALWPLRQLEVQRLAKCLERAECDAVICDISPLGIAVAHQAGLPAVLLENFTWDWIYQPYARHFPALQKIADAMAEWFQQADLHLQTAPITLPISTAYRLPPIARQPRQLRQQTRQQLGLDDRPAILLTMGGHHSQFEFLQQLQVHSEWQFLLTGNWQELYTQGNCTYLPFQSGFYHPDLVLAVEAVVGKIGYSTVAEAWQVGTRFGYIPRPLFAESQVMEGWMQEEMACVEISQAQFESAAWLNQQLPQLLAMPTRPASQQNGAQMAAQGIVNFLGRR